MKSLLNIRNLATFIAFVALVFFIGVAANARGGGGVSVGRASPAPSVARPSFSAPAPIPRYSAPPAPAPRAPAQSSPTIINNNGGGGGGGFGSSFLGGMAGAAVGNALTNHPAPVVVAPAQGYAAPVAQPAQVAPTYANGEPYATAPVVVYKTATDWTWLWVLLLLIATAGIGYFFYQRWSRRKEGDAMEFDPLEFFYTLQQATMVDDRTTLRKLCTAGMAMALSGKPEPGRNAVESLTGVTWSWIEYDGTVEYRFTDVVEQGKRVREHWQFDDGKLSGIEVF